MSDKAIRNAIMTARKFARRKFADGGQPVKIDPVTGLPVPQGGGGGTDGSSASSAPSSPNSSISSTGFSPIDNAIANPGQTATNIGAGIALGALGPVGMGISAANTVSGLFGGPTIGSTLVGPSQTSTPTNVGTVASYSNAPAATTAPASALSSNPNATNFSPSLLNGVDVSSLDSTSTQNSSPSLGVTGLDQFSSANELGQAMGPSESASFGVSGPTGSLSQSGVNGPSGSFGISGPQSDQSTPTSATPSGFDFSTGIIGANTDEQTSDDAQDATDAESADTSSSDSSSSDSSGGDSGGGDGGVDEPCRRALGGPGARADVAREARPGLRARLRDHRTRRAAAAGQGPESAREDDRRPAERDEEGGQGFAIRARRPAPGQDQGTVEARYLPGIMRGGFRAAAFIING